jgi:hypothetical protein
MSFATINRCAADQAFVGRVNACIAGEGRNNPTAVVGLVIWPVSAASDIEAAYASALAADNPDPGGDEAVITDQMILSHVQAALAALP